MKESGPHALTIVGQKIDKGPSGHRVDVRKETMTWIRTDKAASGAAPVFINRGGNAGPQPSGAAIVTFNDDADFAPPGADVLHGAANIDLAVKLDDGQWLNAAFQPGAAAFSSGRGLAYFFFLALAMAAVVIMVVRAQTRPLDTLARAADALGRGEDLQPLPETGPRETQLAVRAFNRMGQRLGRFVQDRTRLLAAMSHDLRTPLTSLRLRAEMIEDAEVRDGLIRTIDDMRTITEANLSFARAADDDEKTQSVDLGALVQSVCLDFEETGRPVTLKEHKGPIVRLRPHAIRRALRNLIDNAVCHGGSAAVSLYQEGPQIYVQIDDEGPGIAQERIEDMFAPYARLDPARQQKNGGTGLGLSIARTIARAHGGDVMLQNRDMGRGLRAILSLPADM